LLLLLGLLVLLRLLLRRESVRHSTAATTPGVAHRVIHGGVGRIAVVSASPFAIVAPLVIAAAVHLVGQGHGRHCG